MNRQSYSSLNAKSECSDPVSSQPIASPVVPSPSAEPTQAIAPSWLQILGNLLNGLLVLEDPEVKVWSVKRRGEILWSAYDPAKHRGIQQVSETEMRQWLEQR